MASVWNYNEQYLKYDSSIESKPEVMPVTGEPVPDGTLLYDMASGNIYARSNGAWKAQ